ncbi:glycoside hydrolase family 31 protein [Zobellia galactanivorans]|uniref:glycoside hydrolase family 31 protein n=1 Tax=Zobellia TaxID=112040 RepID=UPI0026E3FF5C|nr:MULTISPECIES: TIM-barrel domain-containing protein [Zobellia]MDO6519563.1 glycoside hydrolase family 31 protein [Zobellia uliginosa]MDO6810471.1 glycoside hydrolase family 31 protein [Zobellia galactanivorans]
MKKNETMISIKNQVNYILVLGALLSFYGCTEKDIDYKTMPDGIVVTLNNEAVKSGRSLVYMQVLSPTIIKIAIASKDSLLKTPSLIAKEKLNEKVTFNIQQKDEAIVLSTDSLVVKLNLENNEIDYFDTSGKLLLGQKQGSIVPFKDSIVGNQYHIKQNFNYADDEVLYGLGQHELEELNIRGKKIELTQQNTRVSIPVILSTKGYGVYWDNYSESIFDDTGDTTFISSEIGDKIQYYFIKGHHFDSIISGLRDLTGAAPMLPKWAFGYIQSRNRYKNKKQLIGVVKKHRRLKIPLDGIILDYLHWGDKGFGSMVFDPVDFPDPEGMINELHNTFNCKLIVSIWPSVKEGIANWKLFKDKNLLLDLDLGNFGQVYDAFNPKAGQLYFDLVKKNYLDKGVDAIWFDATEPEQLGKFTQIQSFIGPTAKYLNLYSYYDMKNIYNKQRKLSKNRVFNLTRSAFLGQQQFGSVIWSGDIGVDFQTLKEQIPTGLNFSMTGIPYWNTDIGGYAGGDPKDPGYQEVFTRWFQYGTFTPFFRAHGRRHPMETRSGENELWSYGPEKQKILTEFVQLRYRLLPYIYTLSNLVYSHGYTPMRALAFDFLADKKVYEINDQFMFGGDLMVCPVLEKGAIQREVYLPKGTAWFDFWTGKKYEGGQKIVAASPIDILPLFVRAGVILPMSKVMQYVDEKPDDQMEIRIYEGEETSFVLYEDEGDNNNYENGKGTRIAFTYSAKDKTLDIGKLNGEFDGMLKSRTFDIVLVKQGNGTGLSYSNKSCKSVTYKGEPIKVKL